MVDRAWDIIEKLKTFDKIEDDLAILILNQPVVSDPDLVKALWNKAVFRILVDGGANRWLTFIHEHGINNFQNPQLVCGDFDSLKQRGKTYFENKGVEFVATPEQDETDFTKALRYLATQTTRNVDFAIAICENSGRLDQILANLNTLIRCQQFINRIDVFLLTSETVTWLLKPGVHNIITTPHCIQEGYICGLIPFGGPAKVTTSGLKWNLDNDTLKVGELISTSNLYAEPEVRISCNENLIYTTQYRREKQ